MRACVAFVFNLWIQIDRLNGCIPGSCSEQVRVFAVFLPYFLSLPIHNGAGAVVQLLDRSRVFVARGVRAAALS